MGFTTKAKISILFLFVCTLLPCLVNGVHPYLGTRRNAPFKLTEDEKDKILDVKRSKCSLPDDLLVNLPYFTGPLLTTSGHVIQIGHYNIEPYFLANYQYGRYNSSHKLVSATKTLELIYELPVQIGLSSFLDVLVTPSYLTRFSGGKSSSQMGDVIIGLEFQLLKDTLINHIPGVKFQIFEVLPTGKYDNLDPVNNGTDIGGKGAYQTNIFLTFTRTFIFKNCHYLSFRTAIGYAFSSSVHVQGFNSYGGGFYTDAKVKPGYELFFFAAAEYNLTTHVALACDLVYNYSDNNSFYGIAGFNADGTMASLSSGASEQWSVAPAIEYNFNEHIGIIAGPWFTFSGKNSPAFLTGAAALNIYY